MSESQELIAERLIPINMGSQREKPWFDAAEEYYASRAAIELYRDAVHSVEGEKKKPLLPQT